MNLCVVYLGAGWGAPQRVKNKSKEEKNKTTHLFTICYLFSVVGFWDRGLGWNPGWPVACRDLSLSLLTVGVTDVRTTHQTVGLQMCVPHAGLLGYRCLYHTQTVGVTDVCTTCRAVGLQMCAPHTGLAFRDCSFHVLFLHFQVLWSYTNSQFLRNNFLPGQTSSACSLEINWKAMV